ncbi:ABC transporter substrate-binding protein (plasmid) [Gemmobacter fulvus]|uniref:ABC transporter substrate-binding protein n=1 Tax=Gemmobacter fulvus TaxID=2840474 RepID=A0A975S3G2_9RHOB|nr:ABC transporter substrate-binding protein [Gemmobacter fulvus]MBT9247618.1 ABC transporter substrate-binding protein [Gemmobacter fulvus]QWK93184.1 ABC transporter substrate-binding protein [Gemmobacter fulvus]
MIRAALALLLLLSAPAGAEPQRVVALGGTVTEIAAALGAADRLVGRDSTSTYPAAVQALPDVGYLRALSAEGVLSLDPDLILADPDAGPPEVVEQLKATGLAYIEVPGAYDAAGVAGRITTVAEALARPAEGAALAAGVSAALQAAEARAAAIPAPRKRVMFILSLQGGRIMAAGQNTAAEAILALAGADNALTGFDGYKPVTEEAVLAAAPDAILMMDRGGDHATAEADLWAMPALSGTPAATTGTLIRMEGLKLLGFGPRTPEAAQALHDALYGG